MAQAVKALEKTIQEELEAFQQLQKGRLQLKCLNLTKSIVVTLLVKCAFETLSSIH